MPIGIPVAMAIAGAASAGAAVAGSAINAHAATANMKTETAATLSAAQIQAKAQEEALAQAKAEQDYQNQLYAAQQASRAPYLRLSNSALSTMAGLMGMPTPPASGTVPVGPGAPGTTMASIVNGAIPSLSSTGAPAGVPASTSAPPAGPSANTMADLTNLVTSSTGRPVSVPGSTLASLNLPTTGSPAVSPLGQGPAAPTTMLVAPDGTTQAVASSLVPYYLSKGAKYHTGA